MCAQIQNMDTDHLSTRKFWEISDQACDTLENTVNGENRPYHSY